MNEPDEEFEEQAQPFKTVLSNNDYELFKEEDNIKSRTINIRVNKKKNIEIIEDKKVILTLSEYRFSNKEKAFLKTYKGMSFIINGFKSGWRSVSKFKEEIKKIVK